MDPLTRQLERELLASELAHLSGELLDLRALDAPHRLAELADEIAVVANALSVLAYEA